MRNGFRLDRELTWRNVRTFNAAAHVGEKLGHRNDVADSGDVMEMHRLIRQEASSHCGKRSILGAANANSSFEPAAALDFETVHVTCSCRLFEFSTLGTQ